jgi:hypothetical protein
MKIKGVRLENNKNCTLHWNEEWKHGETQITLIFVIFEFQLAFVFFPFNFFTLIMLTIIIITLNHVH